MSRYYCNKCKKHHNSTSAIGKKHRTSKNTGTARKMTTEQFHKISKTEMLRNMRKSLDKIGDIRKHPKLMKDWKHLDTSAGLFTKFYNDASKYASKNKPVPMSVKLLLSNYKRDTERQINKLIADLKKVSK